MAQQEKAKEGNKKKKVLTSLSVKKRIRQAAKHRSRNRAFKSKVHTARRALEENITKTLDTEGALNQVYSLVDKGVKLGILKANRASRIKARAARKSTKKAA